MNNEEADAKLNDMYHHAERAARVTAKLMLGELDNLANRQRMAIIRLHLDLRHYLDSLK